MKSEDLHKQVLELRALGWTYQAIGDFLGVKRQKAWALRLPPPVKHSKDPEAALDRFANQCEIDPTTGCWLWGGALGPGGYGQMATGGRHYYAHRFIYEQVYGPISSGLDLDHLCRVRQCVNPEHLEPVTRWENLRRGLPGESWVKTYCVHGHKFTVTNTYINRDGHRSCQICRDAATKRSNEKKRSRSL